MAAPLYGYCICLCNNMSNDVYKVFEVCPDFFSNPKIWTQKKLKGHIIVSKDMFCFPFII